jgi:VIT1/CCC1 family predicted Fe2+/Mn2+ transporter
MAVNRIHAALNQESIIGQVKTGFHAQNRLATSAGFLIGGFIPLATFLVAHFEVKATSPLWEQMPTALVLGGLFFSAKTVFDWARLAFKHPVKALGFVLLMEGVMTFSQNFALSVAALAYLIVINGIATGCNLVLDYKRPSVKKGS